jgi:Cu/Ag efflux pump CusA
VADAAFALEAATQGRVVGEMLEGMNAFDLIVRVGEASALSARTLEEATIATPLGARIPLRAVAALREDRTPNFISRENVQRKIVVTCNVAGRDIRGVVDDIRREVSDRVPLPAGTYVEYGGQFESAESTGRLLTFLGALVVAGIAALLTFMFRSFRDTLLILVNLPFALVGGVLGVFLSGGTLSVASIIGFITVFGVAARNGIMMVSHIRHLQEHEGVRDTSGSKRRAA